MKLRLKFIKLVDTFQQEQLYIQQLTSINYYNYYYYSAKKKSISRTLSDEVWLNRMLTFK